MARPFELHVAHLPEAEAVPDVDEEPGGVGAIGDETRPARRSDRQRITGHDRRGRLGEIQGDELLAGCLVDGVVGVSHEHQRVLGADPGAAPVPKPISSPDSAEVGVVRVDRLAGVDVANLRGRRRIGQIPHEDVGDVGRDHVDRRELVLAGVLRDAENDQLVAVGNHVLDAHDGEPGQDLPRLGIRPGAPDPELGESARGRVVRAAGIRDGFDDVVAVGEDPVHVGRHLDHRLDHGVLQVLYVGDGDVCVGQVDQHAPGRDGILVGEHDRPLHLAIRMHQGPIVLNDLLVRWRLRRIELADIVGHDAHGGLGAVPPPGVVLRPLCVGDRHRDDRGGPVRLHADHLVGLVHIPGDGRADPVAVHGDALPLHQPDGVQVADIDQADRHAHVVLGFRALISCRSVRDRRSPAILRCSAAMDAGGSACSMRLNARPPSAWRRGVGRGSGRGRWGHRGR